jgi:hypothetical protein
MYYKQLILPYQIYHRLNVRLQGFPIPKEYIKVVFLMAQGLPDVIGAIDGCHIPIKAPRENDSEYINRKCFHSLQLQAVCDDNLMFLDVYCGWPGSVFC